jgi:hypothetical protein
MENSPCAWSLYAFLKKPKRGLLPSRHVGLEKVDLSDKNSADVVASGENCPGYVDYFPRAAS